MTSEALAFEKMLLIRKLTNEDIWLIQTTGGKFREEGGRLVSLCDHPRALVSGGFVMGPGKGEIRVALEKLCDGQSGRHFTGHREFSDPGRL